MSDDPADIRAVLREHGHEPPARGKLSQAWIDMYDAIRGGQDGSPPGEAYDGGVTAADFPPADDDAAAEGVPAERAPRRPRAKRQPLSERLKAARGHKPGQAKRKTKHPRVPVDRVVGMVWEALGRMFMPLSPPTGRCLQMEAPVAGLILEDVVKGTVVDRALQPLARAEEKGKKIIALGAPPAIVFALEQTQAQHQAGQITDAQRMAREAVLVPMLLESLMLWDDVAGEKIEQQMARDAERGPARERAQRIMGMIFAPPTPPAATSPEDDAAAKAQADAMAGAGVG